MTTAQDITRAYAGDWHGTYGTIPSPGHSRRDRGTTVKDGDNGEVLFNSFNGGDWRQLKDDCRARGLLPDRPQDQTGGWRETGLYEYVDASGTVLYRTVRKERAGERKRFVAQRPDGKGGWINGLPKDGERVLYRLPEILAADPATVVFVVEGERKADKLASWGKVATAVAFGAKGWRSAYAEPLAGRTVVILPDNDDEGRGFAERVRTDINTRGGRAVLVDLPVPPKGDIINWSGMGGSAFELDQLVDKALANPANDNWPALDLAACAAQSAPPREWVVEGWTPSNKATLQSGDGGVGKSLLEQMEATCVAAGLPFLGIPTRQMVSAYCSWEDDADELWRRQEAICAVLGIRMADLVGKLHLVSYTEAENPFLVTTATETGGVRVMPLGRQIERLVDQHGVGFLVLDNASQIAGIDHNAVEEVAPFAHWLNGLAKRRGGAVILLHHTNKSGDDWLGSVAYNNQFRSRRLLARPADCPDPDVRVLTNPKANYARAGGRVTFRWFNGAFVRDEDLPEDKRIELAASAAAGAENEAFLGCLRERERQGEGRGVGPSSGPNYAPSQFAGMIEAKGFRKDQLAKAMERLFAIGRIETYEHKVPGKGRSVTLIREVPNTPERTPERLPNTGPEHPRTVAPNTPSHTPYTTYNGRGPSGSAAPDPDDIDWSTDWGEGA